MTLNKALILHKMADIKNLVILHSKFTQVYDELENSYLLGAFHKSPRNLFITGATGVGKSTVYKYFARNCDKPQSATRNCIPVLAVTLPDRAHVGALATNILYALGDPNYKRGSIALKQKRAAEYIRQCYVGLIIIDEVHHFITKTRGDASEETKSWLKNLIDEIGISMAMVGSEKSHILLEDKELDRRFDIKIKLEPFNRTNPDDAINFRALLNAIERKLDLPEPSNLSDPDISQRILCGCNGIIGYLSTLLREALRIALSDGKLRLDQRSLYRAFEIMHRQAYPEAQNPFCDKYDWRSLVAPGSPFFTLPDANAPQKSNKKKPQRSRQEETA